MKKEITILAIETSCDETAAAVLVGDLKAKSPKFELLSNVVHSQVKLHAKWGGVVPELAARAHLEYITPVVKEALKESKVESLKVVSLNLLKNIDYIAVTAGPGLIVSLLVGVEFAKGLSFAAGIPLLPVNHMEGHLFSAFGRKESRKSKVESLKSVTYPIISLVVSGGHTMLVLMQSESKYRVIGSTLDDAAGEAFDKVARLLKLPYPGGPEISKLALKGKPTIDFPRPMLNTDNFDFSFSGLKTAVRYYIESHPLPFPSRLEQGRKSIPTHSSEPPGRGIKGEGGLKANIARSFEDAVVDVLVQKTLRAARKYKAKTVTLTGGVSANNKLRETLNLESENMNLKFFVPPLELCTDNAGMIAIAAYMNLRAGKKPKKPEAVRADSGWEIF